MKYKPLYRIFGIESFIVNENERVVALKKGRFRGILGPGEHRLAGFSNVELEWHTLSGHVFDSDYDTALFRVVPHEANKHLTEIVTGKHEVGVIFRDGRFYGVQNPDTRQVVWKDAGPWTVERYEVAETPDVPPPLAKRLAHKAVPEEIADIEIGHGKVGLLFVDGVYKRELPPGRHMFWNAGPLVKVKQIDTRQQSLDVSGQEVLTKDRVTIRINLTAQYRIADPVKAATEIADFADALYRALQLAFRKALGAKTLDQVLSEKVTIDTEATKKVAAKMAAIGIELGDITLKDVILPGEMRDILNQVVAAEKEAEANVIRRREETNATRSLLNTAKVMADNPVMLRLKELEALEAIAGKVERLTVNNGTDGLLNEIARLRD